MTVSTPVVAATPVEKQVRLAARWSTLVTLIWLAYILLWSSVPFLRNILLAANSYPFLISLVLWLALALWGIVLLATGMARMKGRGYSSMLRLTLLVALGANMMNLASVFAIAFSIYLTFAGYPGLLPSPTTP